MHVARGIAGALAIIVLGTASTAQAQTAAFTGINDAVASRFFDARTTAPDPLDGNRLVIRFNVGRDPATWKWTDFRASTAAFSHTYVMDTISFLVEAPPGYQISKITYAQRGSGAVTGTGRAFGGMHWVVGDVAMPLGQFTTAPTLTRTLDLSGYNLASVPVSISGNLAVFSTPYLGSATVAVTAAEVHVELVPITTQ
jgi:hypothetical protein